MSVISRASLPSTGTGKKNSTLVAAAAGCAITATASAAIAVQPTSRAMVFPSSAFDAGKHEAVDELPLEGEECGDQRRRDEQRPGGEQPPFLAAFGPPGEA